MSSPVINTELEKKLTAENEYHCNLQEIIDIMGEDITTNHQLNAYMKKHHPTIKYYGAVTPDYAKQIPKMEDNSCIILNTKMEGEHWTAVYKFDKDKILFMDSFARPFEELFGPYCRKGCEKITDSELDQEQDLEYEQFDCGQRCIAFILVCKSHGYEYAKWI